MKIIFLDIDGVLNSEQWYKSRCNHEDFENIGRLHHKDDFDPEAIKLLNELSGASIVISSSWRLDYIHTKEDLEFNGVALPIIGATPYGFKYKNRGEEIQTWLDQIDVESYVILDDDDNMLDSQQNNFVKTSYFTGLSKENIEQAKQILGL